MAVSLEKSNRRSLLIDSLAMDLAAARKTAAAVNDAVQELRSLQAQLVAMNSSAAAQKLAKIEQLLSEPRPLDQIGAATASATITLEKLRSQRADLDRRQAILSGLADLGYEVKEGMQTAWIENGRVGMEAMAQTNWLPSILRGSKKMQDEEEAMAQAA